MSLKMSTQKWNQAHTIKLLKIAEKLPALWQESDPGYKNVEKKSQSFTVLANMMDLRHQGFDEIAANKKFRNIKDAILKRLKEIHHYDEEAQSAELQKTYLPHAAYLIEMFRHKHRDSLGPNAPRQHPLNSSKMVKAKKIYFAKQFDWTVQHSKQLLEITQDYPEIWNEHDANYSSKERKAKAFLAVSDAMNIEGVGPDLLRKKFVNLRDTILRKIKEHDRLGQVTEFAKSYYPSAHYLIEYYNLKNPTTEPSTSADQPVVRKFEWDIKHSMLLLEMVQKLPAIWNEYHSEYRSRDHRAQAFEKLMKFMDLPGYDEGMLQKKYTHIRDRVLKKLKDYERANDEERLLLDKDFQKGFYPAAKFLIEFYRKKMENKSRNQDLKSRTMEDGEAEYLDEYEEEDIKNPKLLQNIKFLKILENFPIIWNENHPSFRSKAQKDEAFEKVVELFDEQNFFDTKAAKHRYKNCRDMIKKKVREMDELGITDEGQVQFFQQGIFTAASYMISHFWQTLRIMKETYEEGQQTWTFTQTKQLLRVIQSFPEIWNEMDEEIGNTQEKRAEAFERVAELMNIEWLDATALEKKFVKIRDQIVKRMKVTKTCGADFFDAEYLVEYYQRLQNKYSLNSEVLNKFLKENFSDTIDEKETDDLMVEDNADYTEDSPPDDLSCQEHSIEFAVASEEEKPYETSTPPDVYVHVPKIGTPNCRICLQTSTGDFKLLTEATASTIEYSQIFMYTTGYIVTTDKDFYPASICGTCETEMLRSFEFKLKCEQTEEFLEHLYSCTSQAEADQLFQDNIAQIEPAELIVTDIKEANEYEDIDTKEEECDHIECDADLVKSEHTIVVVEETPIENAEMVELPPHDTDISEMVVGDGSVGIDDIIDYDESMDVEQTIDVYNDSDVHCTSVEVGEDIDDLDQEIARQLEFVASTATTLKSFQPPEYYLKVACHICGQSVLSKTMKSHIKKTHSGPRGRKLKCNQCDKSFKDIQYLKYHQKHKHGASRPMYPCRYCTRVFNNFTSNRYHERTTHLNDKKYKCNMCNRAFITAGRLKIHETTHTKEKTFECSICSKRFSRKSQLTIHVNITHSTTCMCVCDICNRAFKSKKHLMAHYVIHTGERNYKCPVCRVTFTQNHVLRNHVEKLHPNYELPAKGTVVSIKALARKEETYMGQFDGAQIVEVEYEMQDE